MAIQIPNPGTGNGATGDNEFVLWTKVKDNFNDQTNAASRLIGSGENDMSLNKDILKTALSTKIPSIASASAEDLNTYDVGKSVALWRTAQNLPPNLLGSWHLVQTQTTGPTTAMQRVHGVNNASMHLRVAPSKTANGGTEWAWGDWVTFYNTGNTTVDSNQNIKTSSPLVRVFSDHLDKIHEANQLPIEYTRNGVGDYTITGTTGLRENDWQIVIPEDDHRNQLIAFTLEDDNGTIRLKTYKRTFNMTTFMFEPDLSAPLDIPEGRWVDLHFNDLPQEQLDEPIE